MYFIAHVLPASLDERIIPLKQMMLEKYECRVGLKSPAHITLVPPYWMDEQLEAGLRSDLDALAATLPAFDLAAAGFSAFKPRTIFIALEDNPRLEEVKRETDQYFMSRKEYIMKFDTRPFHPHITIATRDLFKKDFHEIWPWFESRPFNASWKADSISLLKHNKKNWDVVHTSQLNS